MKINKVFRGKRGQMNRKIILPLVILLAIAFVGIVLAEETISPVNNVSVDNTSSTNINSDTTSSNGTVFFETTIKDAENNAVSATIEFSDAKTKKLNAVGKSDNGNSNLDVGKFIEKSADESNVIQEAPGKSGIEIPENKYNIKVKLQNHHIQEIAFENFQLKENVTDFLKVDDLAENSSSSIGAAEVYALDPTGFNFTSATVTVTAKGEKLYKCAGWDFAARTCPNDEWIFLQDIMPGQNYTLELTPEDPGYAETGILGAWVAYYTSTNPTLPKYRVSNGTFDGQFNATDIGSGADAEWVVLKSSPTKDDKILVTLDTLGIVNAQIWQGTQQSWGNLKNISTKIGTTNDAYRGANVEYEQLTGRALVVAANGTATANYNIWNGTGWQFSVSQVMPTDGCTGTVLWITLKSRPNSNEILYMDQDSNADYCAQIWNGTTWTNNKTLDTAATTSPTTKQFAAGYESLSGDALVTWEKESAVGVLDYATYNGTWSALAASGFDSGGGTGNLWIREASMRTTDRIMVGTIDSEADLNLIEWNGTAFGTAAIPDAAIEASAGYRTFDVAYIGTTGNVMAVYVDSNNDVPSNITCTGANCFAGTWNVGGTTTALTNFCGSAAADMAWVGLDPDPFSNKITLWGKAQTNFGKCVQEFNGTAWGTFNNNIGAGAILVTTEDIMASTDKFNGTVTTSTLSPPTIYNVNKSSSYAVAGQTINFTATVSQTNGTVNTAWFTDNFDMVYASNVSQLLDTKSYAFGKTTNVGQQFKPTASSYAYEGCVKLQYNQGTKGNVTLGIYNVNGKGHPKTLLTSLTINSNSINSTKTLFCGNFSKTIYLTSGVTYAIVLNSSSSTSTGTYRAYASGGNPYTRGYLLKFGNNWHVDKGNDLIFSIKSGNFNSKTDSYINVNANSSNVSYARTVPWAQDSAFSYSWCANNTQGATTCKNVTIYSYPEPITDAVEPTGFIVVPSNGSSLNGQITLTGNASDNVAVAYAYMQYQNTTSGWTIFDGCDSMSSPYECLWNTSAFSNYSGGYNVQFVPCDSAGNCNTTTSTNHYLIDFGIPQATSSVKYPGTASSVRNGQIVTIRINATDDTGVNRTIIDLTSLNASGNATMLMESGSTSANQISVWNISVTLSGTTTGKKYIDYYVSDISTPSNKVYHAALPVQIDNAAPTYDNSTLGYDVSDPVYNNTNVTFNVEVFDNYNLSYYIFSNNFTGIWNNATNNFTSSLDDWAQSTNNLFAGTYGYYFTFFDEAGNSNSTSVNYIKVYGPEPPPINITMISPADGANFSVPNVTFSYNYSGSAQTCSLDINDNVNLTNNSPSNLSTQSFQQNFSGSTNSWGIECNNSFGDIFYSDERLFNMDITSPSISLLGPADNVINSNGFIQFYFNATDPDDNIGSCSLILNGTATSTSSSITSGIQQQLNVQNLGRGNYTWKINCTDSNGNQNGSVFRSFTVKYPGNVSNATIVINQTMTNSQGTALNATITLIETGTGQTDYNTSNGLSSNISAGTYNIQIALSGSNVKTVTFFGVNVTGNITSLINIDNSSNSQFKSVYGVAPTIAYNYSSANITITASGGKFLYKCANWNFTNQSCIDGRWKKIGRITPGQNYTIIMQNSSDPGFGEFNNTLNVLDYQDNLINSNQTILRNQSDVYDMQINLTDNSKVTQINVYGYNDSVLQSDLKVQEGMSVPSGYVSAYAVDTSNLSNSNITVNVIASENTLYKCANWSFSAQSCNDNNWTLFQTGLTPGQAYTFTLFPGDPGFAGALNTAYILHNESSTQFTNYKLMLNNSVDIPGNVFATESYSGNNVINCTGLSWITQNFTGQVNVSGNWSFNIYTNCSKSFATAYVLSARILKVNATGEFNFFNASSPTAGATRFSCTTGAPVVHSWSNAAINLGILNVGERAGIQICSEVTGGSPGSSQIFWENGTPSNIVIPVSLFITSPEVHLIAPSNNTITNTASQTFNCNITSTGISNLTLNIWNSSGALNYTNTTILTGGATNSTNWTFTLPKDDAYKWNCLGANTLNDLNYSQEGNYTITLDTTAPNGTILAPQNASFTNVTSQNFTINLTDNVGIANATLNIYNQTGLYNRTTITNPANGVIGIVVGLVDGIYHWFWEIVDLANNGFTTGNRTITIDTINSAISIIYPQNITYNTNVSALNYTVSDINLQACWYSLNLGVTNTTVTCGTNVTGLTSTEGSNTWRVYANDSAGNSNFSSVTFSKDTTFPTINFTSPSDLSGSLVNRGNILVNVTASDSGSGLKNISTKVYNSLGFEVGSRFTTTSPQFTNFSLSDGLYYFNSTACDNANNCNSTETRNVTIDATAPATQFVSPSETSGSTISRNNTLINVTAIDDHLVNITIRLFNSTSLINETTTTTSPNFINVANLPNGIYFFNATATDSLGNINNTETRNVTIDTTEVIITFVSPTPANNSAQSSTSVTINATVTNGITGIDKCILEFDGVNQTMTKIGSGSAVTCNVTKTGLAEGQHNFTLFANNSLGTTASKSEVFTVDTITPTIQFVSPTSTDGANLSQSNIAVNVTANDTNLQTIVVRLFNSTNSLINSSNSTTSPLFINFSNLADGIYRINATVNDSAGNVNNTETRTIRLDTNAPNATILAPQNGTFTNVTSQNFTINLTDAGGLANATLNIYNSTGLYNRTTISLGGVTQATIGIVVGLVDGIYHWFWEIVDLANNHANTQTTVGNYTVTEDTNSPGITIISPLNQTYNTTDNILLNFTVTETNLNSCWYSLNSGANIILPGCNSSSFNATAGANSIIVYANDSAGNINSTQRVFSALYNTTLTTIYSPNPGIYSSPLNFIGYYNYTNGTFIQNATCIYNRLGFVTKQYGFTASAFEKLDKEHYVNFTALEQSDTSYLTASLYYQKSEEFDNDTYIKLWIINGSSLASWNDSLTETATFYENETNLTGKYVDKNISSLNIHSGDNLFIFKQYGYNDSDYLSYAKDTFTEGYSYALINGSWIKDPSEMIVKVDLFHSSDVLMNENASYYYHTHNLYDFNNFNFTVNCSKQNYIERFALTTVYNNDSIPPELRLENITNLVRQGVDNQYIEWHSIDLQSGIHHFLFNITYPNGTYVNLNKTSNCESFGKGIMYPSNEFNCYSVAVTINSSAFTALGVYNVSAEAHDNFDNWNFSQTNFTVIDATAPTIIISQPNGTYNLTENIPLQFNAIDANGVSSCWYALDGDGNISLPSCLNTTINVSSVGNHTIRIYANDTTGNIGFNLSNFTALYYNTTLFLNTTKNPVESGEIFNFLADYQYTNGTDVLGAMCTRQVLNRTIAAYYHEPLVDQETNYKFGGHYDATRFVIKSNSTATNYSLELHMAAINNTNNTNFKVWIYQDETAWKSTDAPNITFNGTSYPYVNSTLQSILIPLSDDYFSDNNLNINITVILGCTDCNLTNYWTVGEDNNNFGHSYETFGAGTKYWANMSSKFNEYAIEIQHDHKTLAMTYNSSKSAYECPGCALNIYRETNQTDTWNGTCTKNDYIGQSKLSTITVSQNYVPQPNITATSPNPAELGVNNVTVTWTYDYTGRTFGIATSYVNLSYANGTFIHQHQGNPFVITTNYLPIAGTYNLTAYAANDIGSNISTAYFIVQDTTSPNGTIVAPQNGSFSNVTQQNFMINLTDAGGLANATLNIYNQTGLYNRTTITNPGTGVIGIVVGLVDGIYSWFWEIVDLANNYVNTQMMVGNYTMTEDTIAPIINFTNPTETSGTTLITRNNIIVNVTALDTNLANITINLYDSSGLFNSTTSATSPYYVNFSNLPSGVYYFNATARDLAGNSNSTETRSVTIGLDTTPPAISITYPLNTSYNINVSALNYTISDINLQSCWYSTNNGVTNTTITCGTNVTGLTSTEGSNTWRVYANDSAGNMNFSAVIFTKDTISPAVQFVTPPTPVSGTVQNTGSFEISANASDMHFSSLDVEVFDINGNIVDDYDVVTPTLDLTSSQIDGIYFFNATACDTIGNCNSTETRNITLDTIVPSISIRSPQNTTYNNLTMLINISASDTNLQSIWFYNGTGNTTYTNALYQTFAEGSNTITAYVNDSAGNSNSTSVTFSINLTAPTVLIISPISTTYNTHQILISITNSSNVQSVWFNNGTGNTTYTTPVYQNFSEGSNTVVAYVNDSFGVVSSHSITFTIDTTAPTISNATTTPSLPLTNNGTAQTLAVNFTSSEFPINVTFNLYNSTGSIVDTSTTTVNNAGQLPVNYFIPANLSDGDYNLNMTFADSVGNSNTTAIGTITVLTNTTDADNDSILDTIDTLIGIPSDVITSGVTNLNITVNGNSSAGTFNGTQEVVFYDGSNAIMNFSHNFSLSAKIFLNQINITVTSNSVVVNLGGQLLAGENKSLYLADNNFVSLCVKDAEIASVSEISSSCTGANETDFTSCIGNGTGVALNNLTCTDLGSRIRVDNLIFSGIRGTPAAAPAPAPSVSSGGGGGGSCSTNWTCESWSECASGTQTRTCSMINANCYAGAKPSESQTCTVQIAPSVPTVPGIKPEVPQEITPQEAKRTVNIIYPILVILISLALLILLIYPVPELINLARERAVVIYERPQRRLTAPAERYIRRVGERVAEREALLARRIKKIPGNIAEEVKEDIIHPVERFGRRLARREREFGERLREDQEAIARKIKRSPYTLAENVREDVIYPTEKAIRRFGEGEREIAERLERVPVRVKGGAGRVFDKVSNLLKKSDRAILNKINLATANVARVSENVKNSLSEAILLNTQRIRRKEEKLEGELGELKDNFVTGIKEELEYPRELASAIGEREREISNKIKKGGRIIGRDIAATERGISEKIKSEHRAFAKGFEEGTNRATGSIANIINQHIEREEEREMSEEMRREVFEPIEEKHVRKTPPVRKFVRKIEREGKDIGELLSEKENQIIRRIVKEGRHLRGNLTAAEKAIVNKIREGQRALAEEFEEDTNSLVEPISRALNQHIEREEEREMSEEMRREVFEPIEPIRKEEHPFRVGAHKAKSEIARQTSILKGTLMEKEVELGRIPGKFAEDIKRSVVNPVLKLLGRAADKEKSIAYDINLGKIVFVNNMKSLYSDIKLYAREELYEGVSLKKLKRKSVFTDSEEHVGYVKDIVISKGMLHRLKIYEEGNKEERIISSEDIVGIYGPVVIIKKEAIGK